MWKIIEIILIIAIILVFITEFFVPIIMGKPLFGSFRKSKTADTQKTDDDLSEEKNSEDLRTNERS